MQTKFSFEEALVFLNCNLLTNYRDYEIDITSITPVIKFKFNVQFRKGEIVRIILPGSTNFRTHEFFMEEEDNGRSEIVMDHKEWCL